MEITKEKLFRVYNAKTKLVAYTLFFLSGFLIPLIPIIKYREISENTIVGFVVLLLFFGVPFGLFFGLKPIIKTIKDLNDIKKENIKVLYDNITSLYVTTQNGTAWDSSCQATLKYYSKISKMNVRIPAKYFSKLNNGDNCILIFLGKSQKPSFVFPGNEFLISYELKSKITDSSFLES